MQDDNLNGNSDNIVIDNADIIDNNHGHHGGDNGNNGDCDDGNNDNNDNKYERRLRGCPSNRGSVIGGHALVLKILILNI